MTLKTPRQRRVTRKAIKMARACQREIANARAERCAKAVDGLPRKSRVRKAALARAHRALDLLFAIEDVTLTPPEVMMLRALKRAGRRLNARHA
jgi:hypothetical protein